MGTIKDLGDKAFRDFVTDGVPSSGANKPIKREIRQFVAEVDRLYQTGVGGGGTTFDTLAQANANIGNIPENGGVNIISDGLNNGFYVKQGGVLVKKSDATLMSEIAIRSSLIDRDNTPSGFHQMMLDEDENVLEALREDGTRLVVGLSVGGEMTSTVENIPGFREITSDENGDLLYALRNDATHFFPRMAVGTSVETYEVDIPGVREMTIDSWGNIATMLLRDGTFDYVGKSDPDDPDDPGAVDFDLMPGFGTELVMVPSFGQSWAHGTSALAITTSQRFNSWMFNGGVRPYIDSGSTDPAVAMASFVPLVEAMAPSGNQGETPVSGFCEAAIERIAAEMGVSPDDHEYRFIGAAPATGGQPIANLSKGSSTYNYLIECVRRGALLAAESGKTFSVPALQWYQGKGDYDLGDVSEEYYRSALKKLRADIDADVRAIIPSNPPVVLIVHQTLSHGVAGRSVPSVDLAMLNASDEDPYIVVAGPLYAYPAADNTHYTAEGYKRAGAVAGVAYKRTVIDAERWVPLRPIEKFAQGNIAVLKFNVPKGPLVLDTVNISDPGNYGFEAVDQYGAAVAITSVSLIGSDRVKIVANGPIAKVRYGWSGGNLTGPTSGPRGCLRDSQGDTIHLDPDGANYALHNWSLLFEI